MTFDKLLDIVKMFLEKYLIPTVLSVVLTFVTYYKTPEDFSMLVKFTVVGYCVFAFCIWFLVIYAFIWIIKAFIKGIKAIKEKVDEKEYVNKSLLQDESRVLEQLWTDVDGLSVSDYKLLVKFLETGNKPHYTAGTVYGNCLLNSEWVHCSQVREEKQVPIKVAPSPNKGNRIMLPMQETISAKYQYILRQEIFELLKYSQEKYGKISHFER